MENKNYFNLIRVIGLIAVFVLMFLVVVPSVSAIGITPGRTTIDFEPSLTREVGFTITNTENKNMNVAFTVQGDLKDYISIDSNVVSFSSGESSKAFSYGINLPGSLSPGLHTANIIAVELPEDIDNPGMTIKATVSVVTQVYVYVPYPGKYLDAGLDVVNNENNNLISFYVPLISRGDEAIEEVEADIEIFKGTERITNVETNKLSINPQERKELSGTWNPNVLPGKYKAVAKIMYDGNVNLIEKEFSVGNESLGVLGISVNDFKLGEVARIRILVQNTESDPVEKAFANLNVYDPELDQIANLKSENYQIPASSNKELIVYWDTIDVQKGEYSSELKIDYDSAFLSKNFKIDVSDDSMKFTGVGFVIASDIDGKMNMIGFLGIIIGILVLINLAWLVRYMRNKKKSHKKK